jgi:RHS repeat-associated protein
MTLYTYNTNAQLTSATRPSGLVTTNLYFTSGSATNHLSSSYDYAVISGSPVYYRTNSFTWTNDLVLAQTDPRGLTTTNTWDNLQRLRRVDYPDGTFITNTYTNLDLVQTVDRMGFTNSFGYNSLRQMIAATNANGVVTRYNYCSCGSLDSVTNAFGSSLQQVINYTWDLQGNLLTTSGPDNYSVTRSYNSLGQVTNTTDGLNSATNWYNNQGLLIASSNSLGAMARRIYDALDRATNTTDANSVTITNTFDNLNRLATRGYPDGGVEKFGYTLNIAALTSYTNQLGANVVNYSYDPLGRKTNEVYPTITTNSFSFSPGSDLLTLTDGKNQTTTWTFDQFGRATNKIDAANNLIFIYAYDPNNRLTNRWTPQKLTTLYSYDPVANLTNVTYHSSPTITLAYDVLNRLTNMVDAVGTTRYTYTSAGQVLSEDGPWADDTVSYSYSSQRQRLSLSLVAPNASPWAQSYYYDSVERLTNITTAAGGFSYAYDALRSTLPTVLTLPNAAYITNTFDPVARLLLSSLKNSANGSLNSHAYGYSLASQRLSSTNTFGDWRTNTYDSIGQLTAVYAADPSGVARMNERRLYFYDAGGNLINRFGGSLNLTQSVNSLNELTTVSRNNSAPVVGTTTSPATNVTVNGLNAALYADNTFAAAPIPLVNGTNTFTAIAQDSRGRSDTNTSTCYLPATNTFIYDLNGNLLSDGTRVFEYDDENQLTAVTVSNSFRSEFVYDGKMRRRIRREKVWGSGAWNLKSEIRYIYDRNLVIQERDANNLPLVTYTRGRDLSGSLQGAGGIGGLLARTDHALLATGAPGAHAYYHSDGNGNITALINTNQLIVARYLYDPFGNILSQSGPLALANGYRFSSKEAHDPSGLVYFGWRFYDPSLQRWLNRDPLGEQGFETLRKRRPLTKHLFFASGWLSTAPRPRGALLEPFAYCLNNPLNVSDPFGDNPPDCPSVLQSLWEELVELWREEGSVDFTLSGGEGLGGELRVSYSPGTGELDLGFGFGIGLGAEASVTGNLNSGEDRGWNIQSEVAGGIEVGGSMLGELSQGGINLSAGGGWGVGVGGTVTVGYTFVIFEPNSFTPLYQDPTLIQYSGGHANLTQTVGFRK